MRSAEYVAKAFHDAYEEFAPQFGYETRKESAVPWDEVSENYRNLMLAVVQRLMGTCISCTIPDKFVQRFEPPIEVPREGLVIEHGLGTVNPVVHAVDGDNDSIMRLGVLPISTDAIEINLRTGQRISRVVVIG